MKSRKFLLNLFRIQSSSRNVHGSLRAGVLMQALMGVCLLLVADAQGQTYGPVLPGPAASTAPESSYVLGLPCYINGNPTGGGSAGTADAFLLIPINSVGDTSVTPPLSHLSGAQVGALWGVAKIPGVDKFLTSAVLKRHCGFGPQGIGGVYLVNAADPRNPTVVGYNLSAAPFNISLGSVDRTGLNVLPADKTQPSHDADAFGKVGKVGIGGIDVSTDGTKLYVMNLNLRRLEVINLDASGVPTSVGTPITLPTPPGWTTSQIRPWAVKVHGSQILVGLARDAGSLRAAVVSYDGSTWTTRAEFPISHARGFAVNDASPFSANWNFWSDTQAGHGVGTGGGRAVYPQPILSDIEIDNDGSLMAAFTDRGASQWGYQNYGPNTSETAFYYGFEAGDIHRIGPNGANYILENNASLPTAGPTGGANNAQGPGGGEFYYQESFPYNGGTHDQAAMGALAFLPGAGYVIGTAVDPIETVNAGGIWRLSNSTGQREFLNGYAGYQLFVGTNATGVSGKANGLGDIELASLNSVVAIGNMVWCDDGAGGGIAANGVRDGGEAGLDGVKVELLYDANSNGVIDGGETTAFAFAITAGGGHYQFTHLQPGNYQVRIPASNFDLQSALAAKRVSSPNTVVIDNGVDNDDNGTQSTVGGVVTSPVVALTLGGESTTDGDDANQESTVDFGFVPDLGCISTMVSAGTSDGYELIDGTVVSGGIDRLTRGFGVIGDGVFAGFRFDGVNVPKGATIISANVVLSSKNGNVGNGASGTITIRGEASDNAAAYTSTAFTFSSRADTTQSATWTLPATAWVDNQRDAGTTTPDLSNIVQAIVNRSGWQSGNAMAMTFAPGTGTVSRRWDTFEGDPSKVAQLVICYTALSVGNLVYVDENGDGNYDEGIDTGKDGVEVQLWNAGTNNNAENGGGDDVRIFAGPDGDVATTADNSSPTLTTSGGCYLFKNIPPGNYYVLIPTAEFGVSKPLYGLQSIAGQGGDNTSDDNLDENGDDDESNGVSSTVVALADNGEPQNEAGKDGGNPTNFASDADTNLTVDFGFVCPVLVVSPVSLANGTVGSAYSQSLSASGGTGAYTYAVTSGSLPAGLNLSGSTISGTPTSTASATFTIETTDAAGCKGAREYTVTPVCPTITLNSTPSSLPSGTIGEAYTAAIEASGGTAAYTFALKVGSSLPDGLSLASNGAISGTPTGPESVTNFTVVATDVYGCPGEATFSIGVDCNTLALTPVSLSSGSVGDVYGTVNFSAGGATGAVIWSLSSGTLPAGMTFAGGVLSGTPTEGGSFSFSITATDANDCSGSVSLSLSIPIASISGTIYEDTDDDGDGDVAINVVTVSLCDDLGDPVDNPNVAGVQDYVITTSDGTYEFTNLVPGSYIVKETQPSGYLTVTELDSTADAGGSPADDLITVVNQIPVNVANGETDSGNDFVEVLPLSIGNLVFCDDNINGQKDVTESGIDGVTVHLLFDANDDGDFEDGTEATPIETDMTTGGGFYLFENLRSGNYQVIIPVSNFSGALADKRLSSPQFDDIDNGVDNNDNGSQLGGENTIVSSPLIVLTLGGEPGSGGSTNVEDTVDFGFVDPSTLVGVGNLIFIDNDGDGVYGVGDTAATDVTVELYQLGLDGQVGGGDDELIFSTTTGADGSGKEGCYAFYNLLPGNYYVKVPAEEFTTGDLIGLVSIPGYGGDVFSDDSSDENGIDAGDPATYGVMSGVINLAVGGEPSGGQEDGKDAAGDDDYDTNVNFTVDLGFVPVATTVGLGNKVFIDGNGNGSFDGTPTDTPLANVTLQLFNASAGPGIGSAIATTTSDGNGCYAFTGLTSGQSYIVHLPASQFGSGEILENLVSVPGNGVDDEVDDDLGENGIDSGSPAVTGISSSPIALAASTEPTGEAGADGAGDAADSNIDFTIDFALANAPTTVGIGNLVFIDSDRNGVYTSGEGVDGVTVELYASGQSTATPALATTTTANGGCYVFTGLTSGESYFVHIPAAEFQTGGGLEGSYSIAGQGADDGVDDGTDENGDDPADPSVTGVSTGDIALEVGTEPTDSNTETGKDAAGDNGGVDGNIDYTVDLGFTVEKVATFADWQTDNPLGGNNGPTDNPDGDIYNNALEYALCLKPGEGTTETEPGGQGGFCAELNGGSGEVDAFFVRPEVANDVTYTLQTSTTLGDPTTWTDRTDLTPAVSSNSDGTEKVIYTDLETEVGSKGIVRLKVEIAGDGTGPHYTQTWGWNAETLPAGCRTWSNPYGAKGIYSGTAVDTDYATGVLTSTAGGDVSALLVPGREYYLEMISGIYEGHRFDINEGSTTASGIAIDIANARNTLKPVPADLQGAYEIRAHQTIDDLLPPDTFTAHNNSGIGDRLLLFVNGGWTIVWAYDPSGPNPVQWTRTVGALTDAGDIIIDPCAGLFTHPRLATVDSVSVGVVRDWDFACALSTGYNLVGSGYPMDQTPTDRAMLRGAGDGVAQDYFTSNANPLLADQLMHWLGDDVLGVEGYKTYYDLYVPSTSYDYWTDQTNSNLTNENASSLFKQQRATFYDLITGHDRSVPAEVWVMPAPWAP